MKIHIGSKNKAKVDAVSELMPETAKMFKRNPNTYPSHLWKKGYGWYDKMKRGKT